MLINVTYFNPQNINKMSVHTNDTVSTKINSNYLAYPKYPYLNSSIHNMHAWYNTSIFDKEVIYANTTADAAREE